MQWNTLDSEDGIKEIIEKSFSNPQVILKHSTRCSISSMAKNRLEKSEVPNNVTFHYLDLIANRNISNLVASTFFVEHESPQVLIIKNGECIYDDSHSGISMKDIAEQAA